ncbi:Protein FLX-like 3 [Striga hermonthica]|uniref:Protein FLX-like 3 n=1 Tax=Striga hermonthica TaxID=68872 RepID=A0A9N7RJ82_STRHE|nr:Protein FLX-like 3 [Striga hermonthica]
MAGRNHRMPRHPENFREDFHPGPRHGPILRAHPAALEEELELQHREIQRVSAENYRVVDENVRLQRDLTSVKDEIHRLGRVVMPNLQAEMEAQKRELVERGLKVEAEVRASEPLRAEVAQLRAEAHKLGLERQELGSKVQGLSKDVSRLKAENKQVDSMKSDVDKVRSEILDARRAYEYEKKRNEEVVEQNRAMEKNLIGMAREIEKLRAEQANADRRGKGAGGYGLVNGSPDTKYPGVYGDVYGAGPFGPYDKRQRR